MERAAHATFKRVQVRDHAVKHRHSEFLNDESASILTTTYSTERIFGHLIRKLAGRRRQTLERWRNHRRSSWLAHHCRAKENLRRLTFAYGFTLHPFHGQFTRT